MPPADVVGVLVLSPPVAVPVVDPPKLVPFPVTNDDVPELPPPPPHAAIKPLTSAASGHPSERLSDLLLLIVV
jgi:hypothetical protein